MPKVSVLIPTYNYARFLGEAIESVQAQTFRDFELVIVDDASTDNSAEVATRFSASDPRVRFFSNAVNLGMVQNWNHCLTLAKGDYIQFLFGDDKLFSRSTLGKMAALLDANPTASLAASARVLIDENSERVGLWANLPDGLFPGRKAIVRCLLKNQNLIGEPTAVMFRKSAPQRGFDPAYRQLVDLEMWFHMLEHGDLVYTREPLCAFRRHAAQQTEINNAIFSLREQLMLLSAYGAKPWIHERQRLEILYRTRRSLPRDPQSRPQFLELERQSFRRSRTRYFFPWLKHALKRPIENLIHSTRKRWKRWRMPPRPVSDSR
jgi:glycosyltransferase involved in cell wall biosynthesis